MSTFDKILHLVGTSAVGVLIAGLTGGIAVPTWLMITAAALAYGTGATAGPVNLGSIVGKMFGKATPPAPSPTGNEPPKTGA